MQYPIFNKLLDNAFIGHRLHGAFHLTNRLADAMLVLHQGETQETFALFAESNPRRQRDVGPVHHLDGKDQYGAPIGKYNSKQIKVKKDQGRTAKIPGCEAI